MFNADAHEALLDRHPTLPDLPLNEQALGSNSVELCFSILRRTQGGYEKPTEGTLRSMQTMFRTQNMVTDGDCPISIGVDRKLRYPVQKQQQRPTDWTDRVDEKERQKKLKQASSTATKKRHNAPRESNKAKVLGGQSLG